METALQRDPVYRQLNDRLRTALGKDYHRGDKFLTEREVCDRFAVSRATANKALASLVSEGLLEFRRGIGTFVRRDPIQYDLRTLVSFTEKAHAAGKKPSTKVLAFGSVLAGDVEPAVGEALQVGSTTKLTEMRRLRFADKTPVILEHRWVVSDHCPRLTRTMANGSLYEIFTQRYSLSIAGADEVIRAVVVKGDTARHLGLTPRSPAIEVTAVGHLDNESQSPLWWERTLYHGERYEFHSRLGPIQTATPARGQFRDE